MRWRATVSILAILGATTPAVAALSRAQLATVAATPSGAAAVPLDLPLVDSGGQAESLGAALGHRPALLLLADYRCTQLCGSLLAIAAQALHASGLSPVQDFTLAVVGFNPEAGPADAAAMGDEQIGAFPDLKAEARLLTGSPAAIARLQQAVGFAAIRDAVAHRFAHPADLFVLTADGHVSAVLNGLSLDPATLRLALVEAGAGRIGTLVDRLHVLCYGLDPLTGASTDLAQMLLRVGASLTLLGTVGGLLLAARRRAAAPGRAP